MRHTRQEINIFLLGIEMFVLTLETGIFSGLYGLIIGTFGLLFMFFFDGVARPAIGQSYQRSTTRCELFRTN